jgi:pimeloyl-ACP methyl ester carboxylesterase
LIIPLSFTYKKSKIAYHIFGNGKLPIICLHGYGLNGNSFSFLANDLGEKYTLYCIDFPFHGQTNWNEMTAFTPQDAVECIWIMLGKKQAFDLIAYSMGGRVALELIAYLHQYISTTILIAPDGLHKNKWQWFATQTQLGNSIFKFTMESPTWIFALANIATKFGLLNKSILKFVYHHLENKLERSALYNRWTNMRLFKPNLFACRNIIKKNALPVYIFFGMHDRIILTKRGYRFKKDCIFIVINELNAGHNLLKEKYAKEIANCLLQE